MRPTIRFWQSYMPFRLFTAPEFIGNRRPLTSPQGLSTRQYEINLRLRAGMRVKGWGMPVYLYRWSNGGLSMVLADNAEQAVLRLEEEQEDAGEGEEIERILPEKLKESHRFQAHFELIETAEEIDDLLDPEDLLNLDGNGFGADVDCHLEELYPRIWEVAQRETSLVEAISLLGSGMPVSEISSMYDEALIAEKSNSPLPEPGERPTSLPLTMKALEIFNEQRDKFEKKFDREFGAGDLIFFDLDQPTPQPIKDTEPASLWQELLAGMEEAGISEAVRYATKRTGRVKIDTPQRDLVPAESVRIPVMWAGNSARCGQASERSDAGCFLH
jgi:hypothetical protein